jgi:hypothetical protein
MIRKIVIFIIHLSGIYVNAQTVFISDKSEVSFYSYAPLEDIKAESKQLNGMINTVTGDVAFMIPMRSFHFAKALMEEHFNEKFIESEKYPQTTFKGKVTEPIDLTKTDVQHLTVTGEMNIHGQSKNIKEKGELIAGKDQLTLTSEFYVALKDYNITIPSLLLKNIADSVLVKLKVTYVPYKKK